MISLHSRFISFLFLLKFIWLDRVLVTACELSAVACGILVPFDQESNSGLLHWELRVLTPGPSEVPSTSSFSSWETEAHVK